MKNTVEIDKRDTIQFTALNKWISAGKIGTTEIATGLGKTFIALRALHTMEKDDRIHLYLAETTSRKKDLIESIKKFDRIYHCNTLEDYNFQFHCYQTVRNWRSKHLGLVIADEIHDSLTPENSKFYQYNNYDALLGLSAKIDVNTEYKEVRGILSYTITKQTYLNRYCPIIYSYTMSEARKNNLNKDLTIHIIKHDLDFKKKSVKQGKKGSEFYITELDAYNYWDKKYNDSLKIKDYKKRHIYQKIATSRLCNILYNLESKVKATRKLLKVVDRCIIFGNSVDALQKVTPFVVSSRNNDDKNDYIRRRFENNLIDNIASFKKLKQGANINNLLNMILMSYFSKEGDIIQRFGRLRKNGDEKGDVFIFVTQNTKEEYWYRQMLKEIMDDYKLITHQTLDRCINFIEYKNKLNDKNK